MYIYINYAMSMVCLVRLLICFYSNYILAYNPS